MRLISGSYVITGRFGQPYDANVVAKNPILKRYPWIDLSRGWNVPHCIALELAPRPYGTVGEIQLPVPSLIEAVGIRDSDKAKYVTARINIAGHPLQGLAYQIWHLGEITVSKGQWLDAGVLAGRVGGQYKFTGSGSGAHTSMTMKDAAGKHIDSQPLWDWQPNIVAAIVAKVEEIIHPQPETPKIPPPVEETPTPPVEPPPSEPQKPAEPSPAKVEPKAGDEKVSEKYDEKKAVVLRFLRTFIPQIPAGVAAVLSVSTTIQFPAWVLAALVFVGALATALDKLFRDLKVY